MGIEAYNRAYDEGIDAFENAFPAGDNPYPADTDEHGGWNEGWTDAMHEAFS